MTPMLIYLNKARDYSYIVRFTQAPFGTLKIFMQLTSRNYDVKLR